MLTFFTTAKPFRGHTGLIQRNALKSWKLLHPDIEIILFGDDEGAADVARELNLRHEPHTECNKCGLSYVNYMIRQAQAIARHDELCYSNCDIMLMEDFRRSLERVKAAHKQFLMVGRRWDTDVIEPYHFEQQNWETGLREFALNHGNQRTPEWIDYFVFSRGLYAGDLPPLVIGRPFWDNWLVWKTLDSEQPVIDVSPVVLAVHQNHDYRHHPQGLSGVLHGEEAIWNHRLAGGWKHLRTIADATEALYPEGLKPNTKRHWAAVKRYLRQGGRVLFYDVWQPICFFLAKITRPTRRRIQTARQNTQAFLR